MKKRIWEKRIFSFVTALALCLCLLPGKIEVHAAVSVNSWAEFIAAIGGTESVIILNGPIAPLDADMENADYANQKLVINRSVTIQGNSNNSTKPTLTIPYLAVEIGGNLTIENVKLNFTAGAMKAIFANGHTIQLSDVETLSNIDLYTDDLEIVDQRTPPEPPESGGGITRAKDSPPSGSNPVFQIYNSKGINTIYGQSVKVTLTDNKAPNPEPTDSSPTGSVIYRNDSDTFGTMGLKNIRDLKVETGLLELNDMTDKTNVTLGKTATLNLFKVMQKYNNKFTLASLKGEGGNGSDDVSDPNSQTKIAKWTERTIMMGSMHELAVDSTDDSYFLLRLVDQGRNDAATNSYQVSSGTTVHPYIAVSNLAQSATFVLFPTANNGAYGMFWDKTQKAWLLGANIPNADLIPSRPVNGWGKTAVLQLTGSAVESWVVSTELHDMQNVSYQYTSVTVANDMDGYAIYYVRGKDQTERYYTKAIRIRKDSEPPEFKYEALPQSSSVKLIFEPADTSGIKNYLVTGGLVGELKRDLPYTECTEELIKDDQGNVIRMETILVFADLKRGDYRLDIKVTDNAGNEYSRTDLPFSPTAIYSGDLALSEISFPDLSNDLTYNGLPFNPTVLVELNGFIVEPSNYTKSYSRDGAATTDLTSAGTITVTVTANEGTPFKNSQSKSFTINKAPVAINTDPDVVGEIDYGQEVSRLELVNGRASVDGKNNHLYGRPVEGVWTWAEPSLRPSFTGNYRAIFTPNDSNNFRVVEKDLPVIVNAVQPTTNLTVPSSVIAGQQVTVSFSCTNPNYTSLAGPPYTLSYQIGSGNVSAIPQTGVFTVPANTPADTKITVIATTGVVAGQYLTKEVRATITVVNKTQVRIRDVDPDDAIYDGKPHVGYVGEPMVRRGYEGEFDIKYAGRDGTTYNSNVPPTNAGDYTVTFSVPDSDPTYAGSLTLEFTIEKREVTVRPRSLTVKLGSKAPTLELEFDNIADGENDLTPSAAPVFEITAEDATITDLKDVPNRDGVYDVKWRNINASTFRNSNNYEITKRGSGTITVKETVGWEILRKGSRYYTDVDEYLTGWQVMNNRQYYFDEAGYMATGWYQDEDMNWYLFSETGVMQTGWKQVGGRWYNMKSNGPMRTGWYCDNENRWYMLNRGSGAMQTGWVRDSNGAWYYCNSAGVMQTGWTYASGRWYNMRSDGVMRTGWYSDGRNWYYLGSDGAMRTGWNQIAGSWYYMGSDGRMYVNTRTPDGYRVNASGRMIGR